MVEPEKDTSIIGLMPVSIMTESVNYTVIRTLGKVEVRRYPSMVLATVEGDTDDRAFGLLFDYISGDNAPRQKIAMTAPVISTPGQRLAMTTPVISDRGELSFVLPSDLDAENAPSPHDRRVRIVQVPERTLAVLRFSGHAHEEATERRSRELLDLLNHHGIAVTGEPFLMRYNSPMTPGFLRRNEVAVEVV
jgi:hypothetical protein